MKIKQSKLATSYLDVTKYVETKERLIGLISLLSEEGVISEDDEIRFTKYVQDNDEKTLIRNREQAKMLLVDYMDNDSENIGAIDIANEFIDEVGWFQKPEETIKELTRFAIA